MEKIPVISDIDINGKVVLMRVDHNVVKKGKIKDPFRIERSKKTIKYVLENGGFPVFMSHFGRPRNRKTLDIKVDPEVNCNPIADYMKKNWNYNIKYAEVPTDNPSGKGLREFPESVKQTIEEMKQRKHDIVYLPNTRWYEGEENTGDVRQEYAKQLADLADIYLYDAFGSWQPHASTFDIIGYLPSYIGFLVDEEVKKLSLVTDPIKPFFAVIAGAKISTKIGTILEIHNKADNIILGGLPLNAYICAKYNVTINGSSEDDIEAAKKIIQADPNEEKIIPMNYVIESEIPDDKQESKYKTINVTELEDGKELNYVYDVAKKSIENPKAILAIADAKTIFVNAVMGYDKVGYEEGTARLYDEIAKNTQANIFFGGGDTLGALKNLNPDMYHKALTDQRYFLFTGGGTILKALKEGGPYDLPTIKAIIDKHKA